jgi:hypothetical protein
MFQQNVGNLIGPLESSERSVRIHYLVHFTSLRHTGSYITKSQEAIESFRDELSKRGGSVTPNIIPTERGHTGSLAMYPIRMLSLMTSLGSQSS